MTKVIKATSRIANTNGYTETHSEIKKQVVQITAPNMQTSMFKIVGTAPLVIHRFSLKSKLQMKATMEAGSQSKKGKKREAANFDELYNEARYRSKAGWDGFNAAAIRAGTISACRLVGFKMTLAKLCLFVIADGVDAKEPEFQLVRIYGEPRKLESIARVETGAAYVCCRPIYDEWYSNVQIRFDGDQFSLQDVTNLLSRVGEQVGIGEGRPDSKNSAGMGWGTFRIAQTHEVKD